MDLDVSGECLGRHGLGHVDGQRDETLANSGLLHCFLHLPVQPLDNKARQNDPVFD